MEREIIHDVNQENPEEERKSKRIIKRIFLIIIALFLILLVLSYLVPGNALFLIMPSQFDSYKINQDIITLKNKDKILFENNVYRDLLEFYNNNQQHEIKVCLIGDKNGDKYTVSSLEFPKIISQDFSMVRAEPCSKATIISLHSHPFKSCYFSVHDIKNYQDTRKINKEALIGVMCEPDRFNFYGFQ